jgi:hypothetical protein
MLPLFNPSIQTCTLSEGKPFNALIKNNKLTHPPNESEVPGNDANLEMRTKLAYNKFIRLTPGVLWPSRMPARVVVGVPNKLRWRKFTLGKFLMKIEFTF